MEEDRKLVVVAAAAHMSCWGRLVAVVVAAEECKLAAVEGESPSHKESWCWQVVAKTC